VGAGAKQAEDILTYSSHVSAAKRLSRHDKLIGEDTLCSVLTHRQGIFKGTPTAARKIAFLNQADLPGLAESGHDILEVLAGNINTGFSRVIIGRAQSDPIVLEYRDLTSS